MPADKNISQIYRIVDANLNRLAEGLRVLEEIARMILNNPGVTEQLKKLRHDLVRADLSFNKELLQTRDAGNDVGINLNVSGEAKEKDLPAILVANSRRAQESLRVLEELSKIPEIKIDTQKFKQARFDLYTIERDLLSALLRQDKMAKLTGVYVIIDTESLKGRSHLETARLSIQGGARIIQLRDKTTPKGELIQLAVQIRQLCAENNALFIINDYLDIALSVNADGLHVGQGDFPITAARKMTPIDMIIGCSANTLAEAIQAEKDGADYIGLGAIYPTGTKTDAVVTGLNTLREVTMTVKIPVVAIGGINKYNIKDVMAAGAAAAAVISAVVGTDSPEIATRELGELIKNE